MPMLTAMLIFYLYTAFFFLVMTFVSREKSAPGEPTYLNPTSYSKHYISTNATCNEIHTDSARCLKMVKYTNFCNSENRYNTEEINHYLQSPKI